MAIVKAVKAIRILIFSSKFSFIVAEVIIKIGKANGIAIIAIIETNPPNIDKLPHNANKKFNDKLFKIKTKKNCQKFKVSKSLICKIILANKAIKKLDESQLARHLAITKISKFWQSIIICSSDPSRKSFSKKSLLIAMIEVSKAMMVPIIKNCECKFWSKFCVKI